MIFDKLALPLVLLSSVEFSAGLGGGIMGNFPGNEGDTGDHKAKLHQFTFTNRWNRPPQKNGGENFDKNVDDFLDELLESRVDEDEDPEYTEEEEPVEEEPAEEDPIEEEPVEEEQSGEETQTVEEAVEEEEDVVEAEEVVDEEDVLEEEALIDFLEDVFISNCTNSSFFNCSNSTEFDFKFSESNCTNSSFCTNGTDFDFGFRDILLNSTNHTGNMTDFLVNVRQALNGTNSTGDFVNRTLAGRRLGAFYRNELNYIRVDDEAVDLRLQWSTDEDLVGGHDKYFINPGMIFVDNEDGTTDWVRTIRYHSTGGYSNGVTSYEGQPVNEGVWVYFTSILLGSEKFTGDLSGGFDDASIANWGIQTGDSLSVADNHMLSNEDTYKMWEDLCEAFPGYLAEKHVLTRKKTTGAEDPKLFVLPSSMNERSRWAVTFSSYPPYHALEGASSLDDCKWSDYSKFQMYLAPGGEQLANGIDSPAHRLSCGSTTDHEKNWIAFDYENELYYVQNVQPHVVVKVNGEDGSCEKVFETSSTYLEALSSRVSVRGSATAIKFSDDEYIALLHTHDDYSREPYTTRAYTFEAFPPFRVLRVSKPLQLQSSGLAFASSLTAYENKVMVGYGVADRESRMMVMSRDYLEKQFEGDCDGAVDRLVGQSGETCAEKVIALMLGDEMMPPRRAMNTIGMSYMECRGLLDHRQCEPEMVLKVSRHNKANNCNEAFSRLAAGTSCSARIKWIVENTVNDADEAFRMVSDEYKVCRDILSLGCTKEDLHFPAATCKPNLFNTYETTEPAVLFSMTHADRGGLEPMIKCSGISAARGACENKDVEMCLEEGKFHLVKSGPGGNDENSALSTITVIREAAANVARRELDTTVPKVILHTRNPLEIVFDDVLASLAANGVVIPESKVDIYEFQELSRNANNHAMILRTMVESAVRNIQEWEVMKMFIDNPSFDVMLVTDEELGDRLLQPAIMAEMSRHLGLTPDHNIILDGLQASETMYVKRNDPDAMKSNDFFLESSAVHLQYICHLMEMAPMFLQTTVEQGYRREISILTEYCVGFDEEWITTAGEEIFTGFSETM